VNRYLNGGNPTVPEACFIGMPVSFAKTWVRIPPDHIKVSQWFGLPFKRF